MEQCGEGEGALRWSAAANEMDEDEWMYEIMSEQADMDYENEEACGANEPHVDCSDAFNTSQVFECRDDVLRWARSVAHENGFVAVILRSDTNTGSRGRTTFVLIGCERSGEYRCRKKEFIRRDTETRKCGCPFKLRCKPMVGGEGWMVKLICGVRNHELAKSLVGHPYAGRLTKAEKTLIADMTKSMEHNANSCMTIKQIYNARSAFRSSIRGSDLEMQHLMKLLERDQYIHWHKIKDENMVRDIFWCHPDAVKLVNACNLVFLIDNTHKTNRYKLLLLNFVGVTPTGMILFASFAYVEVIVTDRDQALMNAVKDVFPECTNLLCSFHINKNVKAKCKSLIAQKNAWDYVMDCWGCLTDCPSEQQFDECLKKFEMACAPWPMFVDYVKETWIIPHKEKFVSAWTNKVMHLGNTITNRAESAHSSLKRLLQNSLGDLCSVWDAIKNMITLQHTEIKASFETSTHVVGHVFKKTLYRRLLGMVSRYALNQIAAELERVDYAGKNPSSCGCVVRTTLGLPCTCELSKYVGGCIPLDSIHMFWRRLNFLDQGLSEPEVSIKETKLWEIAYPDQNSMCPPPAKVNTKGAPKKAMSRNPSNSSVRRTASSSEQPNRSTMMPMLDQFQPFMHDFIDKIVDVKADGNCGYRSVAGLLGMGQDSWSVVRNHLLKELAKFSEDYIKLFGGTERFEELRMSLLVDGLTKVTTDKWMDITDMGHVIASRYNVIVVSLSKQQSTTLFPLRSQPLANSSLGHIICIGHVIARTPDGILNLLQATITPTHDALLYYNGRWNMSRQNEFVGYSFTGKNLKKFDIPAGFTMDELKDLIKQVAPTGIPPYGIDETQMVRRLFFRKPSHREYSEKVIKFEIIELKTNDDMIKVLIESSYWKKIEPIEILVVFSKPRSSQMSTVLLAPTREGYLSLEPEGRLGATEHDHLAEDLMPGLVS
ncbi:Protein FAR1-RELATED SEQUENCE 5 [Glycine soja]